MDHRRMPIEIESPPVPRHEFRIARTVRERLGLAASPFALDEAGLHRDLATVRSLAARLDVDPGQLFAAGLLHEALHRLAAVVGGRGPGGAMRRAASAVEADLGPKAVRAGLRPFVERYPTSAAYRGETDPAAELRRSEGRAAALEELLLLRLAAENPALAPFEPLFADDAPPPRATDRVAAAFAARLATAGAAGTPGAPAGTDLLTLLSAPGREAPGSIAAQLRLIRDRWGPLLGDLLDDLLLALDILAEEGRAAELRALAATGGPAGGPAATVGIGAGEAEAERYSPDRDWMPRVVLLAKSAPVWLDQLSRAHGRDIRTLDAVPDEELATLAARGFSGLWLIGIWERSRASAEIKQRMGDPDAAASAYSLLDYRISHELGGEAALEILRARAMRHGIRLASDMVPNHMGIDSAWVVEHPERFLSLPEPPFPSYRFTGPDLSSDERVAIRIEDGYWDHSDAAVVFERVDRRTGERRYVYHGNDGTSMPWNDTAQLDYLQRDVREAVIATILDVARRFPIIRFDAAMTLAKRHVERLWYPPPGGGGAIPSRAEHGLPAAEFERAMPVEFWREVVDRVAAEVPDTLLLAEAFWMLEGYFVRTLGMHRVYNSAFMHMLRDGHNARYRAIVKETLAFDPEVLKRFVNFLNNPDERTAIDQFGDDDRYFCAATLLATLPGLPMFGHGQVEGFAEKYGMEFRRARWEEEPKDRLVERHEREIFPLLHRRHLFAEVRDFRFFDFTTPNGGVAEDVFAFANRAGDERAVVVVHNRYAEARGTILDSVPFSVHRGDARQAVREGLATGLGLPRDGDAWIVYRDMVSGLEHLHSCLTIHERGLEFDLHAYDRRLLLDWRILHDGEGLLRRLAERLGGRGVPSIDAALDALRAETADAVEAPAPPAAAPTSIPAAKAPRPRRAPGSPRSQRPRRPQPPARS